MKKKIFLNFKIKYYLLLFSLIVFNISLGILLIPLFMLWNSFNVYAITFVIGATFGLLITFFIINLDELTHHHHAGIWLVVIFSSISSFVFVYINNQIYLDYFNLKKISNPFLSALFFLIGFIIPYVFYILSKYKFKT